MTGSLVVPVPAEPVGGAQRLPDFLVVGFAKCGTTSLAAHLAGHPEVHMAPGKEVNYFDRHHGRGLEWYASALGRPAPGRLVGEATPTYAVDPAATRRMAGTLPGARLVAIVRNPVDRALSDHQFIRAYRGDARTFAQAVADELADPRRHPPQLPAGYLATGEYIRHVERLTEHYRRDALLVVLLEDLRKEPEVTLARVCRHIGVSDGEDLRLSRPVRNPAFEFRSRRLFLMMRRYRLWQRLGHRVAGALDRANRRPVTTPPMDPALRARLVEHFAPYNRALGEWLGRDLSGWDC